VAPGTELEHDIAAAWREVLGTDQTGLHDNFFDLGGHSLLLVWLQTRLRQRLSTDISPVDLFQYPTVKCWRERSAHGPHPFSIR
jgi:aryl carrier-like protein